MQRSLATTTPLALQTVTIAYSVDRRIRELRVEAIARWSRAAIWGTTAGYLRGLFEVNFLRLSPITKQSGSTGR